MSDISLVDEYWERRRASRKADLWGVALLFAGLGAAVVFILVRLSPSLGETIAGILGVAAILGAGYLYIQRLPREPDSMSLGTAGIALHRPTGERFTLDLGPSVWIRLIDQSKSVERPRRLVNSYSPYVLVHSSRTQPIVLTREAFLALREALVAQGLTLVKQQLQPWSGGTMVYEYRHR